MGWSLGIDFGTTFTTTAMAVDDRIEFLEIDGSRYLPSMVCVDADGEFLVGREAVNEAACSPARAERLPKRAMATAEHVRLGGRTLSTVDLVAAVLRHVAEEATKQRGDSPVRVVLTHPARWLAGGVELERLARAASSAGLEAPDFVAEPVAAAHHYVRSGAALPPGSSVAVYDLGGGTFDTAVLRRNGNGFELAGPPGGDADLGGEDLDVVLMELLAGHAEASDPQQWARLWEDSGNDGHRDRLLLRGEITKAKESLSHRTAVDIYVPGFDEELRITRREYEEAIDALLERTVAELVDTVTRAGETPTSLTAVYLTGGSSRTPHITTLLNNVLGMLPTIEDDPKAVVAQGALEATSRPAPHRPESVETSSPTVVLTPADLLPGRTNGDVVRRPVEAQGTVIAVTGAPQAGKTASRQRPARRGGRAHPAASRARTRPCSCGGPTGPEGRCTAAATTGPTGSPSNSSPGGPRPPAHRASCPTPTSSTRVSCSRTSASSTAPSTTSSAAATAHARVHVVDVTAPLAGTASGRAPALRPHQARPGGGGRARCARAGCPRALAARPRRHPARRRERTADAAGAPQAQRRGLPLLRWRRPAARGPAPRGDLGQRRAGVARRTRRRLPRNRSLRIALGVPGVRLAVERPPITGVRSRRGVVRGAL